MSIGKRTADSDTNVLCPNCGCTLELALSVASKDDNIQQCQDLRAEPVAKRPKLSPRAPTSGPSRRKASPPRSGFYSIGSSPLLQQARSTTSKAAPLPTSNSTLNLKAPETAPLPSTLPLPNVEQFFRRFPSVKYDPSQDPTYHLDLLMETSWFKTRSDKEQMRTHLELMRALNKDMQFTVGQMLARQDLRADKRKEVSHQ